MNIFSPNVIQSLNEIICDQAREYIKSTFAKKDYTISYEYFRDHSFITFYCSYTIVFYKKDKTIKLTSLPNINGSYPTAGIDYIDITNIFPQDFDYNSIDQSIQREINKEFKDDMIIVPAIHFISDEVFHKIKQFLKDELKTIAKCFTREEHKIALDECVDIILYFDVY